VFTLIDYEDSQNRNIKLIKDWKDVVNQVGDNRCLLQSLKDSPYYKGFEDKVSIWERKLAELDEYLQNLNHIQRKWVYLEPIFGRGALPKEQTRFNRVDEDFRSVQLRRTWTHTAYFFHTETCLIQVTAFTLLVSLCIQSLSLVDPSVRVYFRRFPSL
jgi:hypothetical protein